MTCGPYRTMVLRFIASGIAGEPQSRLWENDQSSVTMRPTAPARFARSTRARMSSFDPAQ